ncbi:MAG: DUF6356 family protein [Candidatus Puniceispirillaceae bacterium]
MLNKIFLDHPRQVNETYFQHGQVAFSYAFKLLVASMAATVHALVPSLFERTASTIVAELHQKRHNRN